MSCYWINNWVLELISDYEVVRFNKKVLFVVEKYFLKEIKMIEIMQHPGAASVRFLFYFKYNSIRK